MRSIRNHSYIRAVFIVFGILFAVMVVAALTSDREEKLSLAPVAAVVSICSFAFAPFVFRLVKWEDSGREAWNSMDDQ